MKKKVSALLWRRCQKATLDTLLGESRGQYHIALPDRDYDKFFFNISPINRTSIGGFDIPVTLAPFLGPMAIPASQITFHYLGDESQRKDWNIQSQRPNTAYPLWRQGRGFLDREHVGDRDYIVIARDVDGMYHGRWLRSDVFLSLPETVRNVLKGSDAGWSNL